MTDSLEVIVNGFSKLLGSNFNKSAITFVLRTFLPPVAVFLKSLEYLFNLNSKTSYLPTPSTRCTRTSSTCSSHLDVVYADVAKAFDRVNHQLLVRRLSTFVFTNELIDLIDSYLADRRNYVVIKGYTSDYYKSLSGVLQGSTQGPLLFILY